MPSESTEFQPITSQEELDSRIGGRLQREREKVMAQYADYDELRAKAEQFDAAREASKSDLQKAQDRAAKYKAELDGIRAAQTRAEQVRAAAEEHGVSADLLARMAGDVAENAAYLASIRPADEHRYPATRDAGEPTETAGGDMRDTARLLFGRN